MPVRHTLVFSHPVQSTGGFCEIGKSGNDVLCNNFAWGVGV